MAYEQLLSEFKDAIQVLGIKNKDIETKIGLPQNSLSNYLNGKKELPKKWSLPIESALSALKETVAAKREFEKKENKEPQKVEISIDVVRNTFGKATALEAIRFLARDKNGVDKAIFIQEQKDKYGL
jgi:hypothetical protein